MNKQSKFYRSELNLNALIQKYSQTDFKINQLQEDMIENLSNINHRYPHIHVIVYFTSPDIMEFFVKINAEYADRYENLIIKLVEGRLEDITFFKPAIINIKDIFMPLELEEIDEDICYDELDKAYNEQEKLFSKEDFDCFFNNVNSNDEQFDDEFENNDDDDFDDADIDNLFYGVFDDITESYEDDEDDEVDQFGLNHLIGLNNFKNEVKMISNFRNLTSKLSFVNRERLFPIHYIFTINSGMGITTILKTFSKKLYGFDLIKNDNVLEYKGDTLFETLSKYKEESSLFKMGSHGEFSFDDDYGVIAIDLLKHVNEPDFNNKKLIDILRNARGKNVFVFILNRDNERRNERMIDEFDEKINIRHIDFPNYDKCELVEVGHRMLNKYGFTMDDEAEEYFTNRIEEERNKGAFYNITTVQKIIEEVRINKLFDPESEQDEDINCLDVNDIKDVMEDQDYVAINAWQELDDLIGLDEVKERIKEIVSLAKVQKKLNDMNIETSKNSYHMMFTGNPGTGKTTIARILGKLFKDIGVLSVGNMVEVTRDGLVSVYVGSTAPQVRKKVNEALGSVLFIDEAYSLYEEEGSHNYGKEAIDTLVKLMEDNREDFIVIMAGYSDKMQKLLSVNQGLKERIAYKIDFPDYDAEELTDIFSLILNKSYILEEGVLKKMNKLFQDACDNKGENFANGRLARNIAERLIVKQSMRVCEENIFDKETMLTIKKEDVEALYEDHDTKMSVYNTDESNVIIGF